MVVWSSFYQKTRNMSGKDTFQAVFDFE